MEYSQKSSLFFEELKKAAPALSDKFTGLPTKKNENYKYTNFESAFADSFEVAHTTTPGSGFSDFLGSLPTRCQVVLGNGSLNKELTNLPEGLSLEKSFDGSFEGTQNQDPFEVLSQGLAKESIHLRLAKNTKIPLTVIVHDLDLADNQTTFPRLTITCEEGSQANFLEVFRTSDGFTSNIKAQSIASTHLEVKANAHIGHTKVQLAGNGHTHVGNLTANIYRDANLNSLTFTATGGIDRNNLEFNILETGAHATVNGLYTGREEQHHDNFTLIRHKASHTTSDQLFKGIMDDNSHGVFTGKIVIHRDAQQVDSSQLNKNLLLSKKAKVDTRPQIEVYADDVKCGHGATVGQINEEEVFYLESRGIERSKAQKILCHAFGQDVLDTCPDKEVTTYLSGILFEQFERFALDNLESKLGKNHD